MLQTRFGLRMGEHARVMLAEMRDMMDSLIAMPASPSAGRS